jgi:hypothetical protein
VSAVKSLAATAKNAAVSATAGNLVSGTVYYYRVVAENTSGGSLGATRTFKTSGTLPGATTEPAVEVTKSSGTLTGVVYPSGAATSWYFQYGLGTNYGYQTTGGLIPAGVSAQAVSSPLVGLEAGTVFHYRLVVQHGTSTAGLNAGADGFFETYPSPAPKPKLTVSTAPRRGGRTPTTFTTSGLIRGPASTPAFLACTGTVKVSVYLGRQRLRSTNAALEPNCRFAATATFRKLPGRGPAGRTDRLTVRIRFGGNRYLAPVSARNETVTLR